MSIGSKEIDSLGCISMQTYTIIAALCLSFCGVSRGLLADIIIDDFDDPASVSAPAMENEFVTTLNVGQLNAQRDLRISSIAADPDAHINIASSKLRAQFGNLHPTNPLGPIVNAHLIYKFEPADFTSGNAFLLDFSDVNGSTPPDFLRLLIFDDQRGLSFFDTFSPILLGGRLTAVFPFNEFVLRDGSAATIHFNSVQEVWIELYASRDLNDYTNHTWIADVDRFRVGTVPEPDGVSSFVLCFLWTRRRRGCVV